jgi:hypothetical protein
VDQLVEAEVSVLGAVVNGVEDMIEPATDEEKVETPFGVVPDNNQIPVESREETKV